MGKKLINFSSKVGVFFFGLIISLLFLEVLLRYQIVVPHVFNNDGWWKWSWYMTKKSHNNSFTEFPDQFDPVLGWVPKNNFQTTDEFGSLTFNSAGIRSKREYKIPKQGKKRIVTIGDSFTYGECVGDEETYSAYLEQALPNSEVLNFGVHGYGLDQQLLRLKAALTYSPDAVITGFYNPDITRILLSFREYHKPKFDLTEGLLVLTNTPLPSPDNYSKRLHMLAFDVAQMYLRALQDRFFPEQKNHYESSLSRAILDEMGKITGEIGAQFYLLYLPSYEEVINNKSAPHKAFTTACQEKKAICIDPTASLNYLIKTYPEPARLFRCHYAKEIHKEIAKEIKQYIEK